MSYVVPTANPEVLQVLAGANVTITGTKQYPIINSSGGGGGGAVNSIIAGRGIAVDGATGNVTITNDGIVGLTNADIYTTISIDTNRIATIGNQTNYVAGTGIAVTLGAGEAFDVQIDNTGVNTVTNGTDGNNITFVNNDDTENPIINTLLTFDNVHNNLTNPNGDFYINTSVAQGGTSVNGSTFTGLSDYALNMTSGTTSYYIGPNESFLGYTLHLSIYTTDLDISLDPMNPNSCSYMEISINDDNGVKSQRTVFLTGIPSVIYQDLTVFDQTGFNLFVSIDFYGVGYKSTDAYFDFTLAGVNLIPSQ